MLQYRKAVFDDCENIYHLICEMEQKELVYDKFAGIFQKQIENGQYYCMVCEQNDRIIGMLNLRFEEQLHYSECIAEIMELVIHSEFRMRYWERYDFSCLSDCEGTRLYTNRSSLQSASYEYPSILFARGISKLSF